MIESRRTDWKEPFQFPPPAPFLLPSVRISSKFCRRENLILTAGGTNMFANTAKKQPTCYQKRSSSRHTHVCPLHHTHV